MGEHLTRRLKQSNFSSVHQEAILNIIVTAEYLSSLLRMRCQEFGLTLTQFNILRILKGVYPEGHARLNIIERMLNHAPDVTRLINRLEANGYARRGKSTDDKRLSITYITTDGIELLTRMQKYIDDVEKEVKHKLSSSDAQLISRICERIYEDW